MILIAVSSRFGFSQAGFKALTPLDPRVFERFSGKSLEIPG